MCNSSIIYYTSIVTLELIKGVRGAMEQATDLRNHMSFEDKHSFVFYSLRYLPFLK